MAARAGVPTKSNCFHKPYEDIPADVLAEFDDCLLEASFLFGREVTSLMYAIRSDMELIRREATALERKSPFDLSDAVTLNDMASLRAVERKLAMRVGESNQPSGAIFVFRNFGNSGGQIHVSLPLVACRRSTVCVLVVTAAYAALRNSTVRAGSSIVGPQFTSAPILSARSQAIVSACEPSSATPHSSSL